MANHKPRIGILDRRRALGRVRIEISTTRYIVTLVRAAEGDPWTAFAVEGLYEHSHRRLSPNAGLGGSLSGQAEKYIDGLQAEIYTNRKAN